MDLASKYPLGDIAYCDGVCRRGHTFNMIIMTAETERDP